ncbi:guanylate kinase [Coxiella endosymbiont of Ornithodoros amblus]|uniref:guanylate kinase n=1 Tax=Coxiella endosymbiont of Ornithodoros amblus TaxID=1656166 RepID=UPI00244DA1DA|nr:guanylate kinase [Coxiella endosymbiont of Ornithodoros amblus]MBW5802827.1 guanylate kinase [Coxiella endosymbiont of Ornithodoros amblus]
MNKSNLFIISAPSGAGKTSLVRALVKTLAEIKISISYTTRPKRPGDQEGVDYFFIDEARFQAMVKEGDFLEYATIYERHYGTEKDWVLRQLKAGRDVLLEIDWQGACQIRELFPPALSIFILPPSIEALRERLIKRRQDDTAIIEQRLALSRKEMAYYKEFDYLVVNDNFDQAVQNLIHIISAERLQRDVQEKKLSRMLAELVEKQ